MISDGSDNEALIGLEAKDCFELLDKRGLKYTAETLTDKKAGAFDKELVCLLYTSPSPRDTR